MAGEDELWIRETSSSLFEKYCGGWSGGLREFTIGQVKLCLPSCWGWCTDGCPRQVVLSVACCNETKLMIYYFVGSY